MAADEGMMGWTPRRNRRRSRSSAPAPAGPGVVGIGWLGLRIVVVGALLLAVAPTVVGWMPMVIVGGSMEPVIHRGDVVVVDPKAEVADGDVITFTDPDRGVITHRVRWREADGRLRTRGDANDLDDPLLAPEHVIGKSRLVVPLVGLPVSWASNGQLLGAVAAILLGAVLLIDPVGRRLVARGVGGTVVAAEHVAGVGIAVALLLALAVTATL